MKEKVIRSNVAVIGGGLAGLTAANVITVENKFSGVVAVGDALKR